MSILCLVLRFNLLHFFGPSSRISNVESAISQCSIVHRAALSVPLRKSEKMEILIQAQVELYERIGRTYDNLRKTGSAKLIKAFISIMLKFFDCKWHESVLA